MKKFKWAALLSTVFLLCLLAGCGSKAPKEKDIQEAITQWSINRIDPKINEGYQGQTVYMDITSLEIGDQLTEDRKNITYCTVQMENDQYTAVQEYRLDMVLYDDGEWTLQEITR